MTADFYRRWLVAALRAIGCAGAAVAGVLGASAFARLFFGFAVLAPHPGGFEQFGFAGVVAIAVVCLVGLVGALVAAIPFLALAEVHDLLRRRDAL